MKRRKLYRDISNELRTLIRNHGICPGYAAALVNGRIVPRTVPARIVSRCGLPWVRWLNGTSAERKRCQLQMLRRVRR